MALIYIWPLLSLEEAENKTREFLDEYEPRAIITVEAMACNRKGIRHGALGGPRNSGDPGEKIIRWN